MRNQILSLLVLFFLPTGVLADSQSTRYQMTRRHVVSGSMDVLDAVTCAAAAGSRTYVVGLGGAFAGTRFSIQYDLVGGSTVSEITLTCTESLDGTTFSSQSTIICQSGVCTHLARSHKFAVSADASISIKMDSEGIWSMSCVVACDVADVDDTITMQVNSFTGR